jgi:mannose-6-phosphate isomerase-like protein (cupin superfamily)
VRAIVSAAIVAAAIQAPVTAQPPSEAPLALGVNSSSVKWGPCPPIFPGACEIAVLRGDPTQPNADVLLRVPGGYALPRHKHSSAERMVLLEGALRIKYDGADAVTLTPSTYAYGPAGLAHEGRCVSKARCTLFIAFVGPVDAERVGVGTP